MDYAAVRKHRSPVPALHCAPERALKSWCGRSRFAGRILNRCWLNNSALGVQLWSLPNRLPDGKKSVPQGRRSRSAAGAEYCLKGELVDQRCMQEMIGFKPLHF